MKQREIKFRAWIEKDLSGNPIMFYGDDQYLSSFLRRANLFASGQTHDKYNQGKYELLQFTGLKDKNGKEIYESDLIRFTYSDNFQEVLEVKWDTDSGRWAIGSYGFGSSERKRMEVVGNIYEKNLG